MGRVKTRLAAEIGASAATRFARVAAASLIRRLVRDGRWQMVLAVAPDSAIASPIWPAEVTRVGQSTGDLGARMGRLLTHRSGRGRWPTSGKIDAKGAILIGADIPAISATLIAAAFAVLRRHDAIFGPAEDGGYWLVGLNGRAPRGDMFANVRWSTPFALADTLANFRQSRVGYAAMLGDVDDAASYRRLGHLAGRVILPAGSRGGG